MIRSGRGEFRVRHQLRYEGLSRDDIHTNITDITETAKQNFLPIIFQIIEQNCKTLSNLNLSKFSKNADEGK